MQKTLIPIFVAGLWVTISEFVRNEILFKSYWVNHFNSLGLKFETYPVNGLLWFVWSMLLAALIYKLLTKFSEKDTFLVAWIAAFAMMWIVSFNLQVLPVALLVFAVPLSALEVYVAMRILKFRSK